MTFEAYVVLGLFFVFCGCNILILFSPWIEWADKRVPTLFVVTFIFAILFIVTSIHWTSETKSIQVYTSEVEGSNRPGILKE